MHRSIAKLKDVFQGYTLECTGLKRRRGNGVAYTLTQVDQEYLHMLNVNLGSVVESRWV